MIKRIQVGKNTRVLETDKIEIDGLAVKNDNHVDVPVLNFSNVIVDNIDMNTYTNCPSLSDDSLNNILASLNTLSFTSMVEEGAKFLSVFGLSEEQATKCTSLSNWTTLENNGWGTGY